MQDARIRFFQRALYAWLAFYMLAMLLLGRAAWTNAPVQVFLAHRGAFNWFEGLINGAPAGIMLVLVGAVLGSAVALQSRHRWWLGLVTWLLFRIITHRTWLASNGGVQLMENMLIWSALMGRDVHPFVATTAFWIARLQLLLAYAAAAAHKFTGTTWLDGSALLLVVRDPAFHMAWLEGSPGFCTFLTYATLAFMTLFPLAVWWAPSRRLFLMVGMLFHLSTAIFMAIPQMGLAFIACYAVWLDEGTLTRLNAFSGRLWPRRAPVVT